MIEITDDDHDERYTPKEVFLPLNRLFNFELDPCAEPTNKLCVPYFYTKDDDGLVKDWKARNCFVNPPYSNISGWTEKAITESYKGAFVAFLIPADCSTVAFRHLRVASWGRWEIPFRIKFATPEGRRVDVARSHVCFFLGGLK